MIKNLHLIINLLFPKQNQNTARMLTTKSFGTTAKWLCFVLLLFVNFSFGQTTRTWEGDVSSDWTTAGNWSTNTIPNNIDPVIIPSVTSPNVYPILTGNRTCASITFIGVNKFLTVNSGSTLTVTDAVVLQSLNNGSRSVTIAGAGTLLCGSLAVGTNINPSAIRTTILTSTISNFNITGNVTIYSNRNGGDTNNATFNIESGIVNVDGQISTTNEHSSNNSTLTMATGAQTGTLLLSHANPFGLLSATGNTISLNGTSSTVNYDGAGAQTIRATTYSNLTLSGSGIKTISAAATVDNNLTVSGTAQLAPNAANLISNAAKLILNGGSYTTGGFSETIGTLTLNDNSTIALGAANHTINLAASNSITWTTGKILTITGWTGATGSSGRIFVGNSTSGLNASQLPQIKFQVGAENRDAAILATGEVVPASCPFAGNTKFGVTESICYNNIVSGTNIGGVTFPGVQVDGYVAVNVIEGVQYRIATTNSNLVFIKRLTLFNGSNTTTALATTNAASATTAASVDWTSTFTGVLYVVFNTFNCQTSASTDAITVTFIGGNNTVDSQTAYGTDSWIGHVYNFSDGAGVPPSDPNAFANYLGYFTQNNTVTGTTTSFVQGYGGDNACFPIRAGGTSQSVNAETFAVRYRMRSSLTGCYLVSLRGDDGVRLTVDGVKVFDSWVQQGATTYDNVLVYLNAANNGGTGSDLLFEYYEKNGQNVSNFSMTLFDPNTNTVVAPTPATVCSGVTPGLINGSTYAYNGATVNPTIKFQWETSSSATGPWANVTGGTGATAEDYTPAAITTTGVVTNYYRRILSAVAANAATACSWPSDVISITTAAATSAPTSTAGTTVSCSGFTANWNSVATATSYRLDVSTVSNFASFVTGYQDLNVASVTSYNVTGLTLGTYYYRVRAFNGCISGNSISQTVITVNPTATISGTVTVCQSATAPNVIFTNPLSSPITVTYNINGGTSATVNVAASASTNIAAPTGASGTFTYNLVSAVYQSAPTCSAPLTGSATITVTPTSVGGTISGSTTVCTGTNSSTLSLSGHTGNVTKWQSSPSSTFASSITDITNSTASLTDVNLTVTTYYRAVITSGSCSSVNSAIATITVSPTSVGGTIAGSTAVCTGTNSTTLTLSGYTGTITRWESSLDNFATAGTPIVHTANTYTATNLTAVTSYRAVVTSGACVPENSSSATITINPNPTSPIVGTITNVSCVINAGSVELSGLPAGSWTINQTGAAVTSYSGSTINYTVTGLAAGSYFFTVTNVNGCPSAPTSSVDVTDASSTSWNGSTWSSGTPNATKSAIIASVTPNSPFTANLTACALTINASVIATVPSGITLTIINAVTTNGQLIFENNSSLFQDPATTVNINSGSIVYKRFSAAMKNFDYSYWSSPVAGQTLFNLSPNTLSDKYFSYTGTDWKEEVASTTTMASGIGYIIRTPTDGFWSFNGENVIFPYAQLVQFIGKPNNGTIPGQAVTTGNFYLIGNPYPSALDADEFLFKTTLNGNINSNNDILNGTIYFWTHNTAIQQSGPHYVYSADDYASYNGTGGAATSPGNSETPSGYIASGQSFFASAKGSGTIQFKNNMRVVGDNSQFFKPSKTTKTAKSEKNRLWLNMTNTGGAFKQTLIGYVSGATNDYEGDFDGVSFDANSFLDFYSVNSTNNLVIQGRALPFEESDNVPLGYRSTIAGDFTIAIEKTDGLLETQKIYLEDKQTNTVHDLTQNDYTFTTVIGRFNDRFVVKYTNKTLGTGDFETANDGVEVIIKNKIITVSSEKESIDKVFIYDISGKQLYQKDKIYNTAFSIENLKSAGQVLLVKVVLENGHTVTRKIIFK